MNLHNRGPVRFDGPIYNPAIDGGRPFVQVCWPDGRLLGRICQRGDSWVSTSDLMELLGGVEVVESSWRAAAAVVLREAERRYGSPE